VAGYGSPGRRRELTGRKIVVPYEMRTIIHVMLPLLFAFPALFSSLF
jgi:hypothetical protein